MEYVDDQLKDSGVQLNSQHSVEELMTVFEYMEGFEDGERPDYGWYEYLSELFEKSPDDFADIHSRLTESKISGARAIAAHTITHALVYDFGNGIQVAKVLANDSENEVRAAIVEKLSELIRGGEYPYSLSVAEAAALIDVIQQANELEQGSMS